MVVTYIGVYLLVKVCLSRLDLTCMEVCQDNFPASENG